MSEYTLTIIDTAGVQSYLFRTNNIRQNAGASFLVDCATRSWIQEVLDDITGSEHHNVKDLNAPSSNFFEDRQITDDEISAEVIYAGGGNTAILFDSSELARVFTQVLTKRVMLNAPGLKMSIQHKVIRWESEALGGDDGVMKQAFELLGQRKRSVLALPATMGLSVSSECVFTDLPANGYDRDGRAVSSEAKAKDDAEFDERDPNRETAYKRLTSLINFGSYKPARQFKDLGATHGDSSFIAVVHADGNGIGRRIADIQKRYATAGENRAYIGAMRGFSDSLRGAAIEALQETVNYLISKVLHTPAQSGQKETYKIGDIELARDYHDGTLLLPFRPIVFGGDDVTFVCDGRLGLELAAYYLDKFSSKVLDDDNHAHCRAGVAIVPEHYPFAHAYELAEMLCKSAKGAIQEWVEEPRRQESGVTAMDWHFAVGGMISTLEDVRKREFTSDSAIGCKKRSGDLLMRPVRLSDPDIDWQNWQSFQQVMREFKGDAWSDKRNKIMALREALRRGHEAVKVFLHNFNQGHPLPVIPRQRTMMTEGWQGQRCGYFDAIEALDFYMDLEKINAGESSTEQRVQV